MDTEVVQIESKREENINNKTLYVAIACIIVLAILAVSIFTLLHNQKKQTVANYTNPFTAKKQQTTYQNPFTTPAAAFQNPFAAPQAQTTNKPYQNPFGGSQ